MQALVVVSSHVISTSQGSAAADEIVQICALAQSQNLSCMLGHIICIIISLVLIRQFFRHVILIVK
jgi:hypothetical protein